MLLQNNAMPNYIASHYGLHLEVEAAQPRVPPSIVGAELLEEAVLLNTVDGGQHGPEHRAV